MRFHAAMIAALLAATLPAGDYVAGDASRHQAAGIVVKDLQDRPVELEPLLVPPGATAATLLVLWASWCQPCIHEFPVLNELQRFHGKSGFRVIGLSVKLGGGTLQGTKDLAAKHKIGYTLLFDADGTAERAFGVTALPTMQLLDFKGDVVWTGNILPPDINEKIGAAAKPGEDRGSK